MLWSFNQGQRTPRSHHQRMQVARGTDGYHHHVGKGSMRRGALLAPARKRALDQTPSAAHGRRESHWWWMLAGLDQDATEVDERCSVELQRFDRGAADGRQAQDLGSVRRPGKVVRPSVSARMEQSHDHLRNGIASSASVVFVVVASLAGECEVLRRFSALAAARTDVLQREALMGECGWAAAVFASALGAPKDELTHGPGGILFPSSHAAERP